MVIRLCQLLADDTWSSIRSNERPGTGLWRRCRVFGCTFPYSNTLYFSVLFETRRVLVPPVPKPSSWMRLIAVDALLNLFLFFFPPSCSGLIDYVCHRFRRAFVKLKSSGAVTPINLLSTPSLLAPVRVLAILLVSTIVPSPLTVVSSITVSLLLV